MIHNKTFFSFKNHFLYSLKEKWKSLSNVQEMLPKMKGMHQYLSFRFVYNLGFNLFIVYLYKGNIL